MNPLASQISDRKYVLLEGRMGANPLASPPNQAEPNSSRESVPASTNNCSIGNDIQIEEVQQKSVNFGQADSNSGPMDIGATANPGDCQSDSSVSALGSKSAIVNDTRSAIHNGANSSGNGSTGKRSIESSYFNNARSPKQLKTSEDGLSYMLCIILTSSVFVCHFSQMQYALRSK